MNAQNSECVRATTYFSLENEVVDISQRGSNAFEKQVERLNSCCFLRRVVSTGAQRQTEMELRYKIRVGLQEIWRLN